MTTLKNFLLFALGGAFVGLAASLLVAPVLVSWWYTPGTDIAALCPCQEVTRATTNQLISLQLISMGLGVVASIILAVFFFRRQKQKAKAASPAVSSGTTPPPSQVPST